MKFEWDSIKAVTNFLKHGIAFDEAIQVFSDTEAWIEIDLKHSTSAEKRDLIIGESNSGILLIVFTVRMLGTVTRIISARRANSREKRKYYGNKRI